METELWVGGGQVVGGELREAGGSKGVHTGAEQDSAGGERE